jgi:nitrogenase molybdenum-iron protein beta chain
MQLFLGHQYGCGFQGSGYIGGGSLPSTNTYEQEIVFGGEQRLEETIRTSLEVIDGDFYAVLSGCTAAIIGDDVRSIVGRFNSQGWKVIYAETSGFQGNSYRGYEQVWEAILDQLVKPLPRDANTVNLFGIVPGQDVFWLGNLAQIEKLLIKLGLTVNTFYTKRQNLSNVIGSAGAALNIFLSPYVGEDIERRYSEKFGVPSLRYPGVPIGPTATDEFVGRICAKLDLNPGRLMDEENQIVFDYLQKASLLFTGLNFQHRCSVIADAGTAISLTKFLADDFGQIPAVVVITDNPPDRLRTAITREFKTFEYPEEVPLYFAENQQEIYDTVRAYSPGYVLGSSLDKDFARTIGALQLSVSFPVSDRLILNKSYAGYEGSVTLVEDFFKSALDEHFDFHG